MALQPNQPEQQLLLAQVEALNADQVRQFMVDHEIEGRTGVKSELVGRVGQAVRGEGRPNWEDLVLYLDQVEPYGRQHVYVYKAKDQFKEWGATDYVAGQLERAGHSSVWQQRRPFAAPADVRLASVQLDEESAILDIYAVSRRTHLSRRQELEEEVDRDDLPGTNTIAHIYEEVSVRSWVRLRCDTSSGQVSVHVSQLERKADYEEVVEEFVELISPWFPTNQFEPIDLAKAINKIHAEYEADQDNSEARVQAVEYDSRGGRHAAVSSARARQGVVGEGAAWDNAVQVMRNSGPAATGNFYFRPDDNAANNPLESELHVTCVVRDDRINFRRPSTQEELEWILDRIRYHSR